MKLNILQIKAFTLAEVLITIGIIGVVAALTLPSIIANNKAKALEAGLKKGASTINQALLHYQADSGEPVKADGTLKAGELSSMIKQYFNIAYDCGYAYNSSIATGCVSNVGDNDSDKSSKAYQTLNGKSNISLNFFDDAQFILTDGSMIFFENSNVSTRTYISVDVNGYKKGPNKLGEDLFMFQLNSGGILVPMGAKGTDYYSENDEYCSQTSTSNMNGAGCTAKALSDPKYFTNL